MFPQPCGLTFTSHVHSLLHLIPSEGNPYNTIIYHVIYLALSKIPLHRLHVSSFSVSLLKYRHVVFFRDLQRSTVYLHLTLCSNIWPFSLCMCPVYLFVLTAFSLYNISSIRSLFFFPLFPVDEHIIQTFVWLGKTIMCTKRLRLSQVCPVYPN